MLATLTMVCLCLPQQLQVAPHPGTVGEAVVVRLVGAERLADVPVMVTGPDGAEREVGRTAADGSLAWTPTAAGAYAYAVDAAGVRVLALHAVAAPRPRTWLLASALPLGLALLWSGRPRRQGTAPGARDAG